MKKCFLTITLVALLLVLLPGKAFAQAYAFNIPEETVHVYWHEDGSVSLDYVIVFNNDPQAHAIDYVDLGLPNSSFVDSSITADVNGAQISDISRSGFQGIGTGVAVGLGSQTISPGSKGTVHVKVGTVNNMLQPDPQKGYASAVFAPVWFTTAHGDTNLTVVFHFPKSVGVNDATFHTDQPGWSGQPIGSVDDQGLTIFAWNNPNAVMNQEIDFGASFPSAYVFPTITPIPPTPIPLPASTSNEGDNTGLIIVIAVIAGAGYLIFKAFGSSGDAYEAPKVSVEGYGVKRGLTAVEAAVVLKEPIDKILTMILFSVVKKGAAQVITNDPLVITVTDPIPNGLQPYETQFLSAFKGKSNDQLREALESVMVSLFKDVNRSMDGFNREQTIAYYKKIVQDAWTEVETADTPEVTSQKFEERMDWTMLDQEYTPRTQRLFENKPVFLPVWWSNYDPTIHRTSASSSIPPFVSAPASSPITPSISAPATSGTGGTPGGKISLPTLPGAEFAASVIRGPQNFSSKVIGDINAVTKNVIARSAPPPPPPPPPHVSPPAPSQSFMDSLFGGSSTSGGYHPSHHATYHPHPSGGGGGGGHHCACACAGGGR